MESPDPATSQAKHVPPQSHGVLVSKSLPLKHATASVVVALVVVEVDVVGDVVGTSVVVEEVSGER
jgi:hypothetical protein